MDGSLKDLVLCADGAGVGVPGAAGVLDATEAAAGAGAAGVWIATGAGVDGTLAATGAGFGCEDC
jgi:hypothetical protein